MRRRFLTGVLPASTRAAASRHLREASRPIDREVTEHDVNAATRVLGQARDGDAQRAERGVALLRKLRRSLFHEHAPHVDRCVRDEAARSTRCAALLGVVFAALGSSLGVARVSIFSASVNEDPRARDALEVKLAPWQTEASRATRVIIELDRSDPELAKRDPLVAGILSRVAGERGAR